MEKPDNVREMQALISLIDDPDNDVFKEITKKIFIYGSEILPHLESAWENTIDPAIQKRIEELVHQIQFNNIRSELNSWNLQEKKDLLTGWLIISRYNYPELKEENVKLELNNIRKDIWLELNNDLTALEKIKVFNHILYDNYGFAGNVDNYHDPQNHFINKVLETKKGNPASLGLFYMLLAQSLDIPVHGINFPEHFILAYISGPVNPHTLPGKNDDILFFINAFSKGNVFSRQEAEWFLKQLNLEPKRKYFRLCSNNEIMERMLFSLITSYERNNELESAREVKKLYDIVVKY